MSGSLRITLRFRFFLLVTLLAATAALGAWQSRGGSGGTASANAPAVIPNRYIVTLRQGVSPRLFASLVDMRDDAVVVHTYDSAVEGFAGALSGEVAAVLASHPFVVSVEPDTLVTVTDQTLPTGITRVGADENANSAIDGIDNKADIDIAVIDTGVDIDHADLNVVGGFASYYWWRFCGAGDDTWDDGHGHGTHVSGTIAARDNNIGVVGMVPGARIWAVRVLNSSGSGCMSDVIAGVDWVTANAGTIEVANMSLGGGNSPSLCEAIANSVDAGVFYAVAAGNSDTDADNSSPANCTQATTVSAIVDTDGLPGGLGPSHTYGDDDTFASFTNYGSVVDIAAPGVSIYSTYFTGGYAYMSGTSMASPHVAGAAALHILKSGAPADAAGVQAVNAALIAAGAPQGSAWGATGDPDSNHEPILCVGTTCAGGPTSTPTDTAVPTDTPTPVPPTSTPTPTNTPLPPTDTPTPTNTPTPLPPTDTPTPSDTPTPLPPTNTPTPTDTPLPPTNTPTPTDTPLPPTVTPTPTDTPIPPTPTFTPTPTATPTPGGTELYLTLSGSTTLDGIPVDNEDIVAFDGANFTMYFDGSDVGIGGLELSSFDVISSNEILMSFRSSSSIAGVGTVDDSDIVKFTATSLGSTTSGSFELYFNGSDVGLSTSSEDIDALDLLPNGHLLISTIGSLRVSGASAQDEDLVEFAPSSLGAPTAGTWSLYFDGSDVGLSDSSEDVDAAATSASGNIYLSTTGSFSVAGLSGRDEDAFVFVPTATGSNTSGTFQPALFFDGSAFGIAGDVSGIDIP